MARKSAAAVEVEPVEVDYLVPVPAPSPTQARDLFDGPVVPLLLGAMAIAGVAGAVIDGAGMVARAVRR